MAITSEPADTSAQRQAAIVTVAEVERTTDPLIQSGGGPTEITRIRWLEPLPFAAPTDTLFAVLNVVAAAAGAETVEQFRVGSDDAVRARHAGAQRSPDRCRSSPCRAWSSARHPSIPTPTAADASCAAA